MYCNVIPLYVWSSVSLEYDFQIIGEDVDAGLVLPYLHDSSSLNQLMLGCTAPKTNTIAMFRL